MSFKLKLLITNSCFKMNSETILKNFRQFLGSPPVQRGHSFGCIIGDLDLDGLYFIGILLACVHDRRNWYCATKGVMFYFVCFHAFNKHTVMTNCVKSVLESCI